MAMNNSLGSIYYKTKQNKTSKMLFHIYFNIFFDKSYLVV